MVGFNIEGRILMIRVVLGEYFQTDAQKATKWLGLGTISMGTIKSHIPNFLPQKLIEKRSFPPLGHKPAKIETFLRLEPGFERPEIPHNCLRESGCK